MNYLFEMSFADQVTDVFVITPSDLLLFFNWYA